ncbi:MAG TPA: RNA 2',3'-cyclic phosphodiesterase [Acidimicrobiia bacterium]|nr:RNA 2',3'-cyclic phosphodiesterase [Acidimicrobiia bacterium]
MVGSLGRVFTGVPLPPEVRLALDHTLRQHELPGTVAPPENWHLTLRFLGTVDEVTYQRFVAGLDDSDLGKRFRVTLGGLGGFPNPKRATVLWVGLAQGLERLGELASIVDEAAQAVGLPPEERPFRPHLTLSRIRPQVDVSELIEAFGDTGIGWRCETMVVYRSHLGRGGARYEPLEIFSLRR